MAKNRRPVYLPYSRIICSSSITLHDNNGGGWERRPESICYLIISIVIL